MGLDVEKYGDTESTQESSWSRQQHVVMCCDAQCEGHSYRLEIRRLKSSMIEAAAYLARELQDEDIPEGIAERLRQCVVLKLKASALDGT